MCHYSKVLSAKYFTFQGKRKNKFQKEIEAVRTAVFVLLQSFSCITKRTSQGAQQPLPQCTQ
jgi:hypothetical protein